jgi:hypothetical protein
MRCWGKVRDKSDCRRTATTWCLLGNVHFALCDRHAAANEARPLRTMRIVPSPRSSAR